MLSNEEYKKITKDIAGARTKSRFQFEIAHGISIVYEEYLKNNDFFIIFDYACDIEKWCKDKISFYQLKTRSKNFKIGDFLTIKKGAKKSILQTLIDLKCSKSVDKLYIVSNVHLDGEDTKNNKISNANLVSFDSFRDETKRKINENIRWPLGYSEFKNLFYCVSNIMLKEQDNTLIGLTDKFLNAVYPNSYSNPSMFKTVIMNEAREKACYENDTLTLDETIKHPELQAEVGIIKL